ncbi:MAG: hypothetical protein H9855_16085 [Candidatus Acinetobacter avistercoris]|uniref:hypothetical protein n=1 Tax=Acinetobacter sp. KS-LM10 TaxID=3120518 RepID=UPI001F8A91C1|nr:hypothetical protein [Candidatus Acinetobacter avistercoris]
MSDSQQQQGHTRLLLNIAMVVLETFYSFVLKHDRVVRLQAKKLIEQESTIRINSYIPYFDFYIQFTNKGLLFDLIAPEKEVDLSLSSTLIDLIQVFVFANRRSLKKMRIEGDAMMKDEFRDLLLNLSIPKLLSDWKTWLSSEDDESTISSNKRLTPLLEKIDLQRSKINTLQVEVKQYKNRVKRLQRNQKRINIAFSLTSILFIALIVYNLFYI